MKDWANLHFGMDPDAELQEADALLEKANALLRKHRPTGQAPLAPDPDDDLPILTEIVEDFAPLDTPPVVTTNDAPGDHATSDRSIELAEFLIDLDTELAREIELWFANELPQLVANEMDRMADRLRIEALGHMRATLIPALSERIAARLDKPRKT